MICIIFFSEIEDDILQHTLGIAQPHLTCGGSDTRRTFFKGIAGTIPCDSQYTFGLGSGTVDDVNTLLGSQTQLYSFHIPNAVIDFLQLLRCQTAADRVIIDSIQPMLLLGKDSAIAQHLCITCFRDCLLTDSYGKALSLQSAF